MTLRDLLRWAATAATAAATGAAFALVAHALGTRAGPCPDPCGDRPAGTAPEPPAAPALPDPRVAARTPAR
jgi:hypothetical protein